MFAGEEEADLGIGAPEIQVVTRVRVHERVVIGSLDRSRSPYHCHLRDQDIHIFGGDGGSGIGKKRGEVGLGALGKALHQIAILEPMRVGKTQVDDPFTFVFVERHSDQPARHAPILVVIE